MEFFSVPKHLTIIDMNSSRKAKRLIQSGIYIQLHYINKHLNNYERIFVF